MKKKLLRNIALSLATVTCGGLACVCGMMPGKANGDAVIPETAYLGQTINLPDKMMSYGGQDIKTSILITAPDGGKYSGSVLSIDQVGNYTVEYYAIVDGSRRVLETETITVVRRASDMFETNEFATAENGVFAHQEGIKGVRLSLGNGGVATFAREFDVSDFDVNLEMAQFLVEGSAEGVLDFSTLVWTITDVEDPDNYVTISMVDSGTNCFGIGTYIKIGAPGQIMAGYEKDSLHTHPSFGTPIYHCFRQQPEGFDYQLANLYFDYEEKQIWTHKEFLYGGKFMIADMDSPTDFATLWNGFTSNKVRISVSASGLSSATGNVIVTKIMGYDLSQDDLVDTVAPSLEIDYAGETSVPVAVKGSKYRVFDPIVRDNLDNNVKMEISAYYQPTFDSTVKVDVAIIDGYFTATQAGVYTLHYKASDVSGNVTEKDVQVLCAVSGEPIVLTTTDTAQTVSAWETVKIGGVESLTGTGGNGNLQYTAKVVSPNGEEVKLANNAFVAKEMGVYEVVYTATDYLGMSASTTVEITVQRPTKPIFVSALYLPDKLVKGFEYTLPQQIAQEAKGDDMVDVPVSVYVNGEKNTSGKFIATGESVEIKYTASGETGESQRVQTLEVVDANNGKDQEKYFFGENLTGITNDRDYVSISMNGDANVSFINSLNTANFRFAYSFADGSNLSAMKIKLTDANDKTLSATITLTKRGQAWSLTTPFNKVEAQFTDAQGNFEFVYKNDTHNITDKNAKSCGVVMYYDNGDAFEGFSDTVYLTVEFENVLADTTVRFMQLNNQPLGYRATKFESRRDRIAPEINISSAWAVKNTIGDKVTIAGGKAYDVLGYVKEFTVSVTAPNEAKVLDGVSAEKDYEIQLDQYGDYRVEYYVADNHGMVYTETKLLRVVEREVPTLKVVAIKTEYKVGDTLSIPKYELSDNSGEYMLDVMLIMPDNEMRLLLHDDNGEITSKLSVDDMTYNASFKVDENTFRFERAGSFILRFFAYDGNFNYVTIEYAITVVDA